MKKKTKPTKVLIELNEDKQFFKHKFKLPIWDKKKKSEDKKRFKAW